MQQDVEVSMMNSYRVVLDDAINYLYIVKGTSLEGLAIEEVQKVLQERVDKGELDENYFTLIRKIASYHDGESHD